MSPQQSTSFNAFSTPVMQFQMHHGDFAMRKSVWIGIGGVIAVFIVGTLTLLVVDRNTRADGNGRNGESYTLSELDVAVAAQNRNSPNYSSPPDARMAPPPGVVASAPVPGGGISVSAAPGVAFSYSYSFRLPNANIAGVQEQHAAACEKLGLDRCRITGMRYTVSDQDDVRAMLALKLAPDLARQFGKDGIAAIQKAQGSLVDAAISGNDVGSSIDQSRRRTASLEARIKALEAQRKAGNNRRYDDSYELTNQIATLRTELDREAQSRTDAGEALANTPMAFQYNSGNALSTSALGEAWATSTNSFVAIIGLFVIAIGLLLPWLLLAAAGWLLFRRFKKPTLGAPASPDATP